jgi:hypothetical protein
LFYLSKSHENSVVFYLELDYTTVIFVYFSMQHK